MIEITRRPFILVLGYRNLFLIPCLSCCLKQTKQMKTRLLDEPSRPAVIRLSYPGRLKPQTSLLLSSGGRKPVPAGAGRARLPLWTLEAAPGPPPSPGCSGTTQTCCDRGQSGRLPSGGLTSHGLLPCLSPSSLGCVTCLVRS